MTTPQRHHWAAPLAAFLIAAGFMANLHKSAGGLTDRDGFYHARLANMLPERGLSRSFPWMQASIWRDRFCDKEFLYHLVMAPFAQGAEPLNGALLFSTLLSAAVFAIFYAVVRSTGAPAPWAWTLLLAGSAGPFLLRVSYVRPHVLAILIVLVAWHALLGKNWRGLFVLSFLLSWSYSFPLVLPALVLVYAAGFLAAGERFDWRLAAAAGGVLAGLVIHPYFPHSLESLATYLQVIRIAALERSLAAVELGRELAPYSTRGFLQLHLPMSALLIGLSLSGWVTTRRLGGTALGTLAAAWAAYLGTWVFPRFVEYAAPLCVLAGAVAARDLLREGGRAAVEGFARLRPKTFAALCSAILLALTGAVMSSASYARTIGGGNDPPRFGAASLWMAENLKPNETVVNLWWDDFPELFYSAPGQRFLVGLDPTYMLRLDPQKALRLEAMRAGRIPLDPDWLARTFGARVMVLRAAYVGYYPQLDWHIWKPVFADEFAAIYALGGTQGPTPAAIGPPPPQGPPAP